MGANPASRHDPRSCFLSLRLGPLSSMLSYAALCRRSGAKSLGQTLIVLNLAKASHSRKIAALRDFDPADVRFGSFTSFPPSRRVPFAPKSRHSASARVYEYTA